MLRFTTILRLRRRRGNAMVEGALVLTIVLFTLLGILDVGQVLITHQALTERVRAGARWAVVNAYDTTLIKNLVVYNTTSPDPSAKPLLGLSTSMVSVTLSSSGTPEAQIEVRIDNYPYRFITPLIKGLYSARSIRISMPVEGLGSTS